MDRLDLLLTKPFWIIDILPMQVPKNSAGQYFNAEYTSDYRNRCGG